MAEMELKNVKRMAWALTPVYAKTVNSIVPLASPLCALAMMGAQVHKRAIQQATPIAHVNAQIRLPLVPPTLP